MQYQLAMYIYNVDYGKVKNIARQKFFYQYLYF